MCNREVFAAILLPCHAIAMTMSLFRLHCQWRKRRLWWDDYFVAVGLVGDIFCVTGIILRRLGSSRSYALVIFFVYFVTWIARIGIGLSITRNCAPIVEITRGNEKIPSCWPFHAMNLLFGAMFLITTVPGVLSALVCTPVPNPRQQITICPVQKIAVVAGIVMNIVSDVILIIVPLYILRRVKLTRKQRRATRAIFAASAICSAPSIAYVIGQQTWSNRLCLPLAFQLKAPITLMVCNLLVIVTNVYSRFGKEDVSDQDRPSWESDKPILTTCVITESPQPFFLPTNCEEGDNHAIVVEGKEEPSLR